MSGPDDPVEIESKKTFAATLKRIEDAIASHGMTIFARMDHAAAAKEAGLAMPPTVVLSYGNPKGGTPMMLASPRAALDLPLRVLIREDGARVLVSFHPIAHMLSQAGVPEALAARLEPAQHMLRQALDEA